MTNNLQDVLITAIRCAVIKDREKCSGLSAEELAMLFKIAKLHDVANIVADGLDIASTEETKPILTEFAKQKMLAMYRYMQIKNEARSIYSVFDEAKIAYMPLKGAVIRKYYDDPAMRTSADIDILVHIEDLDKATAVLNEKLEYEIGKKSRYDVSIHSPSGVHIELHFKLTSEDEQYDSALSTVWSTASLDIGSKYRYIMSNEMLVAYSVMHTAKHFRTGGCGVRFFLDLFLLDKNVEYDKEKLSEILGICELYKFYLEILNLSHVWFGNTEHTELTKKMQSYIMGSGIYGTLVNEVAISRGKTGSNFGYLIKRVFPPISKLSISYPKLKKAPILYPFYVIKRWFRIVFRGNKHAINELKANSSLSEERINRISNLFEDLNLK